MKTMTGRPENHDEIEHFGTKTVMLFMTSLSYHIPSAGGGNAA